MRLRGHLLPFVLFALSASLAAQAALFAPVVTYSSGGRLPYSVAVADVNSDGKPDLVTANFASYGDPNLGVGVLLGNGDGFFQPAVSYYSGGYPYSVAVADVNADGKPDLLVANHCVNSAGACSTVGSVGVLLGNGDGTFQPATIYSSSGYNTVSVAVSDFNGDRKPDLVVTNLCIDTNCQNGGSVDVFLGNGDGSFQPAISYDSGGANADSVAVGDVNGDGKLDLLVANQCASMNDCQSGSHGVVGVLLGEGDGTFQPALPYNSGGWFSYYLTVADVNGDGKLDIVAVNESVSSASRIGSVSVLLGNDGSTFQPAVAHDSGGWIGLSVAVADVNEDGKQDLLVANQCASQFSCKGSVGVLLGNGDGTFQPAVAYDSGGEDNAHSVAVADVNGDGKPDVLVTNECGDYNCTSGSVGVLLNITPSPYKAFVQQPINSDGTSIFKASRGVVPVKFTLTQNNAATCQLPAATISVTRTAGGTLGSVDENSYSMAADSGQNFRIDQTACQYVYNLAASVLGVGTYEVDIKVNGVVVGSAVFALR